MRNSKVDAADYVAQGRKMAKTILKEAAVEPNPGIEELLTLAFMRGANAAISKYSDGLKKTLLGA